MVTGLLVLALVAVLTVDCALFSVPAAPIVGSTVPPSRLAVGSADETTSWTCPAMLATEVPIASATDWLSAAIRCGLDRSAWPSWTIWVADPALIAWDSSGANWVSADLNAAPRSPCGVLTVTGIEVVGCGGGVGGGGGG